MSEYTAAYRAKNFATGYTAPEYGRGVAWHQDANSELAFPHSIPMEQVDKMIGWDPIQVPMLYTDPKTGNTATYGEWVGTGENRKHVGPKVVLHGETFAPIGKNDGASNLFGYRDWFLNGISEILEVNKADLGIGFLGLFRNGASAALQIELERTIVNGFSGIAYRPFLYAATSLDGSMKPQYGMGNQLMVCDNTFRAGVREAERSGLFYSLKQTRNATRNALAAREALGIMFSASDAIGLELEEMCKTTVSPKQWAAFLDEYAPVPEKDPNSKTGGRGYTIAAKKRDELDHLWQFDNRVAPWAGTKFGVSQAVTTWSQHFATVKGASRLERNKMNMVTGKATEVESAALATLERILTNA